MATNTKNYNLVKPAGNELADISVINKNMDTIDEQLMPVNSLASEDSKKALAAAQGKVLKEKMGDLSTLNTQHKENLVQAINEAAEGSGITVVTQSEYEAMQEAGTIDPDKLYGIVDAYDFSAGNVAISDVLAGKLGLASGKNVDKALEVIDEKVGENSSSMLKKDGTVQMTGVLKTSGGGTNTIPVLQMQMGDNAIYNTDEDNNITIVTNAYFDGTNWKYKTDGTASILAVYQKDNAPSYYYAGSGIKDAVISWTTSAVLTNETGLPLTGGTLSGDLLVNKPYPLFIANNTATSRRATMESSVDGVTKIWNFKDGSNYQTLGVLSEIASPWDALYLYKVVDGVTTQQKIYGEHNITISTTALGSALAEGAQHQVY